MTTPEDGRVQIAQILKALDGCACCLRGVHEMNGDLPPEVHTAIAEARQYLEEAVQKVEDAHSRCSGML